VWTERAIVPIGDAMLLRPVVSSLMQRTIAPACVSVKRPGATGHLSRVQLAPIRKDEGRDSRRNGQRYPKHLSFQAIVRVLRLHLSFVAL